MNATEQAAFTASQAAHRQALATEKLAHATLMQAYAHVFVAAYAGGAGHAAAVVEQFKIRCA